MLHKAFLPTILLAAFAAKAQTTYLPLNTNEYQLLDRLETRSGKLTNDFFTTIKPIPRKGAVEFLLEERKNARDLKLTKVDRYNIDHAISVSGEWTPNEDGAINSKLPWFKTFYTKQPDFLHVKTKDFFLAVNPVISGELISENANGKTYNEYWTSRGLELRGWISKKIGFYTYLTDNQERVPSFVDSYITRHQAVPGADYYTKPSNHYDYFLAKGYIDFAVIKNHINVTLGRDKFFWGDGMRSLFLSDISSPITFLRLNTKIWKLNYQNLYVELTPQFTRGGADDRLPHKYATMHTLSVNATKWLNIGLYEAVTFSRRDRYEFSYMIPLIFFRAIERSNGSPDKVNVGINFKAIAAKHLQFYGQFLLNEFTSKEFFSHNGYWANKWGLQLGGKYFDAFGVKNLDIQAELNMVRPYTYSHYDSTDNFTNYNQYLAHPLGAGFREFIGLIRYQPTNNLFITAKGMYYQQGVDTGMANYGSDPFKNYNTRTSDYGVRMINGVPTTCFLAELNGSYRLRDNLYLDLGITHRRFKYDSGILPDNTSTYFTGGFRLNIAKRDYNFY
ncbi:MAG: hypothetical protein JSS78_00840 [Bacteroidetes bacterium]|nr:hypothetical protein [Bacteroidota bacterium]